MIVASLGAQELGIVDTVCDVDLPTCSGGVQDLRGARIVAVSPDGNHVYVVALVDSSLAAYSRSSTTGALTFVEVEPDGVGGTDGLAGAHSVTVSPDGRDLLTAAASFETIAVLTDAPIFADGFESGGVSSWSSTVP